MKSELEVTLPAAPPNITDAQGFPRFGTYAGGLREVDFNGLRGPYQLPLPVRLMKEKKWLYTFIATPKVVVLCAVLDLRYTTNAFCTVVDLERRRALFDQSFLNVPGPHVVVGDRPGDGCDVRFRTVGATVSLQRPTGEPQFRLDVDVSRARTLLEPSMSLRARLTPSDASPIAVIAPVADDGVVNVTQKTVNLGVSGEVDAGGRHFLLDGGVAGMDFTHGYLARHTAWRWAFGCGRLPDGRRLSFNLVEGFNEASEKTNENALWVDDRMIPLGRARFAFDRSELLDPWTVSTDDGVLTMSFKAIHAHRELRDYKLLRSKFVQPVGLFSGEVTVDGCRLRFDAVPGVTEDQDVLW